MPAETFIKEAEETQKVNELFPVFFKLNQLRLLIIGAGKVGLEKLNAVLQNSPHTRISIVAETIHPDIIDIAAKNSNIRLNQKSYDAADLNETDIVVVAVNDIVLAERIKNEAHEKGLLVNVADKPELCDFYLGSIVQKGNLKIAISTNGKSPTIAKRLKEVIHDMIPNEMENVLDNMQTIRKGMNNGFNEKVKQLNELTEVLVSKQTVLEDTSRADQKKWPTIVKWCLLAFLFMIVGHAIFSWIPMTKVVDGLKEVPKLVFTKPFLLMLTCGFLAQMVDGSLGMGYGTISTTFLLSYGVSPAIVSSRVHSARVFSSGVSGYSHHRFGNINKKLFRTLVIPGVIGAAIGATLAFFGQKYADYVRLPLSAYTFYLGYFIIRKAFKKRKLKEKVKNAGWLASVGGFMDAFAGGGWGTLVTSTLMSKRKSPRYVIGSVCLAEFFVVLTSSITFFILLRNLPLLEVAGLITGGLIAAPIAARLVGKLPMKAMFIAVGLFVVLASLNTLWKTILDLMH